MSINHHLLAKETTESILSNFKRGVWKSVSNTGVNFSRSNCQSTFPSPDAAFVDDPNKLIISFEFKPPTETKRGILTGLGQSIAYLKFSNLSYLVIPEMLGDYKIAEYMDDLFKKQIKANLPVGLISFKNNRPSDVNLLHNVSSSGIPSEINVITNQRYWAKWQDLPIPLFHLLLHCYFLKKTDSSIKDAFSHCWDNFMLPIKNRKALISKPVTDVKGNVIKTPAGRKDQTFGEKKIKQIKKLVGTAKASANTEFQNKYSSSFKGDGGSMSVRKYCLAFMKHMRVIDSENNLTEYGLKMYNVGLIHGPNSKLFIDYFTKGILLTGHHLDIIFDLDKISKKHKGTKTYKEIKTILNAEYESKGMVKKNPNRIAGVFSNVELLKYEDILWNSLGLKEKTAGLPEVGFNWEKITEVCTLPEL